MVIHVYFQSKGGREGWIPGACWLANVAESVSSGFSERPCLRTQGAEELKRTSVGSTSLCTRAQRHVTKYFSHVSICCNWRCAGLLKVINYCRLKMVLKGVNMYLIGTLGLLPVTSGWGS